MNIFQVLSQGKSRLHEPSMSAMLGYLLDSNKDHGLGDIVVRKLLESIDSDRFKMSYVVTLVIHKFHWKSLIYLWYKIEV